MIISFYAIAHEVYKKITSFCKIKQHFLLRETIRLGILLTRFPLKIQFFFQANTPFALLLSTFVTTFTRTRTKAHTYTHTFGFEWIIKSSLRDSRERLGLAKGGWLQSRRLVKRSPTRFPAASRCIELQAELRSTLKCIVLEGVVPRATSKIYTAATQRHSRPSKRFLSRRFFFY